MPILWAQLKLSLKAGNSKQKLDKFRSKLDTHLKTWCTQVILNWFVGKSEAIIVLLFIIMTKSVTEY